MKKLLCVLLCVALLVPTFICVNAKSDNSGTIKFIAYNVSGIPVVGDFQGTTFTTTNDRARKIGRLLNGTDVDFIGTEEDFDSHKHLAEQMTNYPYRSFTSGGLAQGQGLNVFSPHPLYNIYRENWKFEFGSLSGSMDALANKGFIYALMEFKPGVYIHVINVHMDAGYDPLSIKAKISNFKQLAEFINNNLNDGRALIVQGDFNFKFKRKTKDDIYNNLLVPTGLTDVWVELYNNGSYDPYAEDFNVDDGDTLDRILYRSGKDVEITPVSKTVPPLTNENGDRYTDHDPMLTEFKYTVKSSLPAPSELKTPEPQNETVLALKEVLWGILRVFQVVLGVVELPYLIVQGIDLLINGKLP
ncbi:MAG: hypothetical protein IJU45_07525 [Clostridia bacterium]|nr:hypothetical protein [Clostridia bacterium]